MAIYLTKESKVLVQGMTGGEGMKHTRRMLAAGTDVVGGVNPRKAGRSVDFDDRAVPVFGSVREGIEATGADVSVPDLETRPMRPGLVMSAGMMPALDWPGLIRPGQLGPTIRVPFALAYVVKATESWTGMPSVMTTARPMPASAATFSVT